MLLFGILTAGIVAIDIFYFYYRNYERQFRAQAGRQLAAIAELKVNQLVQYRKERLGDANTFYPIFPKQTSQAGVSGIQ